MCRTLLAVLHRIWVHLFRCTGEEIKHWLVILPKRHIEALHELTKEEFQELAEIEYKLVQVMHIDPSVQKEYLMCFAEGEGFHHVHIHVVPKPVDLPVQLKGPRVFALLAVDEEHALAAQELTAFCEEFTRNLGAIR